MSRCVSARSVLTRDYRLQSKYGSTGFLASDDRGFLRGFTLKWISLISTNTRSHTYIRQDYVLAVTNTTLEYSLNR